MVRTVKQLYETPLTVLIEVKHEGMICASEIKTGSSVNDWVDGGTTTDELYL